MSETPGLYRSAVAKRTCAAENAAEGPLPRKPHILFLNAAETLGADVAVHTSIARALDRRAARVSVATNRWEAAVGVSARETFAAISDLNVLTLDLGRSLGSRRGVARVLAMASNARSATNLTRLSLWCRRNHVDIIHVTERPRQTLFGLYVARLADCACVIHAHTGVYPGEVSRVARWQLHQADAVVGVSAFTAGSYVKIAGVPARRVFPLLNAVDADVFTPERASAGRARMRARLGVPADSPLIGCVARMTRWKAQHVLIDAFAQTRRRVPEARLVLAGLPGDSAPDGGTGDYRDFLVRRADALGLSHAVVFPGFLPQTDMPEFYGAIDVLAHPSFEEPFGLVLVEAMASEKPVVAINGGGVPEIIKNGRDGYLVEADAAESMATAILRVLTSPDHARELGQAGRRRVLAAFTPEMQASAMLKIYKRVLARRSVVRHRR